MKYCLFFGIIQWVLFLSSCETPQSASETTSPPNILFIMTDDHAKNAVSAYGSRLIQTPNIDRLAREGIKFNRSFVTNSICGPSRAVFLTSKYSHINGFKDNSDQFDSSQQTYPKILQANGYYTAVVGKWHLRSVPQGFDYWNVLIDQGHYYNPDMVEMGDTSRIIGYTTDVITDIAIRTIDQVKDQPFCIMVQHKAPHRNWMPNIPHLDRFDTVTFPLPPTFYDDYRGRSRAAAEQDMEIKNMFYSQDMKLYLPEGEIDPGSGGNAAHDPQKAWAINYGRLTEQQKQAWDAYYKPISDDFYARNLQGNELQEWLYQRYMQDYLGSIVSVDENIGRLLDHLEQKGILDQTLVVYTSDQGFFLGEHGWYDKRFIYEESMGMPLVMRWPEKISQGAVNNNLVLNLDMAPTLLEIAGISVPSDMQGRSFTQLFDKEYSQDWRKSVYYHYYEYPHGWHKTKRHNGVRTDRYKLIHFYNDIDDWELYDLEEDPYEVNNLYQDPDYQSLTDSLKSELARLIDFYGDTTVVQ